MITEFARAAFALILTLGLIGLGAVVLRRFGPDALARFGRPKADRRLAIVESLVLDPARRLVIVSYDGQERLLLLGEGQLVTQVSGDVVHGASAGPAPVPIRPNGQTKRRRRPWRMPAQRAAFLVARFRGGVNRSAIAAIADGTRL